VKTFVEKLYSSMLLQANCVRGNRDSQSGACKLCVWLVETPVSLQCGVEALRYRKFVSDPLPPAGFVENLYMRGFR
jgi:hypothetical protein